MNRKKNDKYQKEVFLNILRSIHKNPHSSQRDLAENLGISLGKLNYLIQSLTKKGLIKIKNFSKSERKINYIYVLTPEGFRSKIDLTMKFMQIKIKEYDDLKNEINNQRHN